MSGDTQERLYYQSKVTNARYKSLIEFGGGGGVHVLIKEKHHLFGVWTESETMLRPLQCKVCLLEGEQKTTD